MLNLTKLKLFTTGFLASLALLLSLAFIPTPFAAPPAEPQAQDTGLQANVFSNVAVSTTPQAVTVACGQGSGSIGRKTLVLWNAAGSAGAASVTAELRDDLTSPNFTSGYLAVSAVAAGTASSDTALPSEAAGKFCRITVVSASTSNVTVTLRRE